MRSKGRTDVKKSVEKDKPNTFKKVAFMKNISLKIDRSTATIKDFGAHIDPI
ncbi:hypothetical protein [Peribacillus glennii]|uniref:hypothetical protein n=1 Tax=Peribacillus glennii TaxID=2303991 RepID=UPI001F2BC199|nr:hypothetical protein [Peribacillus glennii]